MSMDPVAMRNGIKTALASVGPRSNYASDDDFQNAIIDAWCGGIIDEIKNATITQGADSHGDTEQDCVIA